MRTHRFGFLLILAALVPWFARAVEVQATSSTQYLRYADFLSDEKDQQDVAEYLRVSARFDDKGNVTVEGYGRILGQLTTSVEPRNGFSDDVIGRLYYLYLDYRDLLPNHLDLRLGRTFVGSPANPGIVDGGQVVGKNLLVSGLGATAFGGRRVYLDNKSELPYDDDYLFGGSVFFDATMLTRAEVSYARELIGTELAREAVAVDLTTTPSGSVNAFGRYKYDMAASRTGEVLLGVKLAPVEKLAVRIELYQSTPSFDSYSFYRYFNVEQYRQATLAAEYRFGSVLRLAASYAYEKYDADEHANVIGAGLWARPLPALSLDVFYENRSGYAGKLGGLRAKAAYAFTRATILAGADYDDFRRQDSRDGTSKKYWAGADVKLTKMFGIALRAERDENFYFDPSYQGWLALDVHL
jgi:uncharacterized protein (TIGR02996 family)